MGSSKGSVDRFSMPFARITPHKESLPISEENMHVRLDTLMQAIRNRNAASE